jgi:hypothetical protein
MRLTIVRCGYFSGLTMYGDTNKRNSFLCVNLFLQVLKTNPLYSPEMLSKRKLHSMLKRNVWENLPLELLSYDLNATVSSTGEPNMYVIYIFIFIHINVSLILFPRPFQMMSKDENGRFNCT